MSSHSQHRTRNETASQGPGDAVRSIPQASLQHTRQSGSYQQVGCVWSPTGSDAVVQHAAVRSRSGNYITSGPTSLNNTRTDIPSSSLGRLGTKSTRGLEDDDDDEEQDAFVDSARLQLQHDNHIPLTHFGEESSVDSEHLFGASVNSGSARSLLLASKNRNADTYSEMESSMDSDQLFGGSISRFAQSQKPYSSHTGTVGGVDSAIRRAQESMRSFQRDDSAKHHLVPEELDPPPCPALPEEPTWTLKTSRRCLERVRLQHQQHQRPSSGLWRPPNPYATFALGLPRRLHRGQNDPLLHLPRYYMTVDCESCRDELIVPKSVVVVECPRCHKISSAGSQRNRMSGASASMDHY
jgi:hypothetical protein